MQINKKLVGITLYREKIYINVCFVFIFYIKNLRHAITVNRGAKRLIRHFHEFNIIENINTDMFS